MASPALNAVALPKRFPRWVLWPVGAVLLYLITLAAALAWNSLDLPPSTRDALGSVLWNMRARDFAEAAVALLCLAGGLWFSKPRWLLRAERWFTRLASNPMRAMLLVGALPVIVRVGLLPALPIPEPRVADEFGNLLLADTFASGRLTNPTHPFWRHFEAIYVFHQPTYTSIYPVAPALLLAIPKALGADPWWAVCLGTGFMCSLICWMLQGWVPPKWAFLGGLLAVCRFSVASPWMNNYWGGTTASIGGALVVGALPRILRDFRPRDSILFALGLGMLAQSRPYEGLLLSIPLIGMLLAGMLREKRLPWGGRLTRAAVPLTAVLVLIATWTMYYNWRVTGHPWLMPYLLHRQIYGTPQSFAFQPPVLDAPRVHSAKDIADVFQWQLDAYREGFTPKAQAQRLALFWTFFLQPLLTLPLLWLPFRLRDKRMSVLALVVAMVLAGNGMYPFFQPHYTAPLLGIILLLVVQGLRYLGAWKVRARRAGAGALALLLPVIFGGATVSVFAAVVKPGYVSATGTPRAQALEQLTKMGGKHLVLVRYSPDHSFHDSMVYNAADIDHAPVVWARALDPASDRALVNYYRDRKAWLFNPDRTPPILIPFTDKPYLTVVAGGAGVPDDNRKGVSPGELALLLGGNFSRDLSGTTNPDMLGTAGLHLIGATEMHGLLFKRMPAANGARGAPPFSVQFGGRPAPILTVSNFEGEESLAVQVPFDLPPGTCLVSLSMGDWQANARVRVQPATPGILQVRLADGRLYGLLLRRDGSLVDREHPAQRGESLRLLVTGLGALYPQPLTGVPGPAPPVSRPLYKLVLGIDNRGVAQLTTEYAPGLVGVEQISFTVPSDTPAGQDVPLLLAMVIGQKTIYSNRTSFPVAGLESKASRKNLPVANLTSR
jgi:uncharacterized protein (TIGR03437 family)